LGDTMSIEDLQKHLQGLREVTEQLGSDNPEIKSQIDQLITEIELHLQQPDDANRKDVLVQGLENTIEQFEINHPRVTELLNRIIMALGNIGI